MGRAATSRIGESRCLINATLLDTLDTWNNGLDTRGLAHLCVGIQSNAPEYSVAKVVTTNTNLAQS